jgi:heat shock protein HtpX
MASLSPLRYKRLFLPPWTIPLQLTLAFVLVLYLLLSAIPPIKSCASCAPAPIPAFAIACIIAVLVGVIGMLFGIGRNVAMRGLARQQFGVTYLPEDSPLTRKVHSMARQLGLPLPVVGIIHAVNAFAVGSGPKDAAVVIGVPLLHAMSAQELEAVIGHELGHIATRDMSRMQMAAGFQSMFEWGFRIFGWFLQVIIAIASSIHDRRARDVAQWTVLAHNFSKLADYTVGIVSHLLTLRLSRSREYYADAIGAALTSKEAMQNALKRIHGFGGRMTVGENEYASMMFRTAWSGSALSTHPTLADRLAALENEEYTKAIENAALRRDRAVQVLGKVTRTHPRETRRAWAKRLCVCQTPCAEAEGSAAKPVVRDADAGGGVDWGGMCRGGRGGSGFV